MSLATHEHPQKVNRAEMPNIQYSVVIKKQRDYFWLSRNFNLRLRKPLQWFIKRSVDYTGSFVGLLLLSPLLLTIALFIKLDSRGPVFFKQKRIGLYGKPFYMYKYRSMYSDAEKKLEELMKFNETNTHMFKMTSDPRITKIGRFLRRCSLDELPQLINVLRGEMSLVGPRPPLPNEVEVYEPWHYLRFSTYPGITGLWQVSGRSNIKEFSQVVKLDYEYVTKWNIALDIWLLLKTIPAVIFAKGAS